MSPARKDDESVQTSLRELMQQEEDRLAQLRAAKVRIDRERAEAAREAEELRARREREERAELEAKKAAAIERARIEALAKAEAERVQSIVVVPEPPAPAPQPRPSRFAAGFATGVAMTIAVAAGFWLAFGAPRVAHAAKIAEAAGAELETEKAHGRESRAASEAAFEEQKHANEALRAENDRLRKAAECPKMTPKSNPAPPRHPTQARVGCNPRDPLCGDL